MDWVVAIIVAPIVTYVIIFGVLWLSHVSLYFAADAIRVPMTGTYAGVVVTFMLVLPLIAAYVAARKWIKFCIDQYGLTLMGITFHVIVVTLAVAATLVRLVMTLPWGSN